MIRPHGLPTAERFSRPDFVHQGESILSFLLALQEECGGSIPFHRFMSEALHHPRFGYYGAHISDVGARGDFSTSATLSGHLGSAIAAWAVALAREQDWKRLPLIEIGAGSGDLARTVLRKLGWFRRLRSDYLIVESSPVLRARQKRLLRGLGVKWHDSVKSALAALGGRALIFSNELVDAFPCRLFEKTVEGWKELGVTISPDGGLSEYLIGNCLDDPWFSSLGLLPTGQRVERHDSYRPWLSSWAPSWREGALLTIDYGDEAPSLYERRPGGSLRAYWKHRRITGSEVYARLGKQDLTADVNFSDLIEWGRDLGWITRKLTSQREFLQTWNPAKSLLGEQYGILESPDGAGEAFKVLEQVPGS
jgi:SAM-dependent MidA family methyltransferase